MLPESVTYTRPYGGMFVWLTLPDGIFSMDVFECALRQQVAVLPGIPFYVDGGGQNTLRVNFSNATPDKDPDRCGTAFCRHPGTPGLP